MSFMFGVLFVVAMMVPLVMLNGFALVHLWRWFVMPFGLPALTLAHAVGIALVAGMLNGSGGKRCRNKGDNDWEPLGDLLLRPLFALGIGWLVHTAWMPR